MYKLQRGSFFKPEGRSCVQKDTINKTQQLNFLTRSHILKALATWNNTFSQ